MLRKWLALTLLISIPGTALAQGSQIDLGISVADGKLRSFHLAVSNYYRVPEREVLIMRDRYHLRDEEIPVLLFMASHAGVKPSVVIDLRRKGRTWLDIAFHFGLPLDIFFPPVRVSNVGPPYGKAYGYYKKYRPTGDWKKMTLSDVEIVDLVNLRFISEHHRIAPEDVISMRGRGDTFITINSDVRQGKLTGREQSPKGNKGQAAKKKKKRD